jgi:hypothetical protein
MNAMDGTDRTLRPPRVYLPFRVLTPFSEPAEEKGGDIRHALFAGASE